MKFKAPLVLFLFLTIGGPFIDAQTLPIDDAFDKPLRKQVVDLGQSIYNERQHNKLSCYFYKSVLIKQLDEAEEGAEWVGIVPISDAKNQNCSKKQENNELRIDQNEWDGYFDGVLGDRLFLSEADGFSRGMGMGIFDLKTAKKIYEINFEYPRISKQGAFLFKDDLRIRYSPDKKPFLQYTAVYQSSCSLVTQKIDCWKKIQTATGIKQAAIPLCKKYLKDASDDPSMIYYPAETILDAQPTTHPIPGPIRCEAAE